MENPIIYQQDKTTEYYGGEPYTIIITYPPKVQ